MDNISITDLQYLAKSGMMQSEEVLAVVMKTKIAQVKSVHKYAITPPKREKGRWQTSFRKPDGTRINVRGNSEEDLLLKLFPMYFNGTHIDKMTLRMVFDEWLDYKSGLSSPNTIKRHKQHYAKYVAPSKLDQMELREIDDLCIEMECNRIVREFNLSNKEWVNLKTVINGCFEYARKKKYILENPMALLKISVKFRQVNKKTGTTETFNTEELVALNRYLDEKFGETHDVAFLAVKLNLLIGLRVGELGALKWEDIVEECSLHVVREEIRNQETNEVYVVPHTKTNTDRYVFLTQTALKILQRIPRTGVFLFERNGERVTERQINYILEKYAERSGTRTKSSHKMRKTYASVLSAAGVPLDEIRAQLGHSSLKTTLGYIYNPFTESHTHKLIESAFNSAGIENSD